MIKILHLQAWENGGISNGRKSGKYGFRHPEFEAKRNLNGNSATKTIKRLKPKHKGGQGRGED